MTDAPFPRFATRAARLTRARVAAHGTTVVRRFLVRVAGYDLERLSIGAFAVVLGVFAGARIVGADPWAMPAADSYAYWVTRDGLGYASAQQGQTGAYLYSPAFAQLVAPLVRLPWPVFAGIWTILIAVPLLWLIGRYAVIVGLLPPVAMSIGLGQIDLAFAAIAIAGMRYPALWALPILTKITPGVGLVWFLVRREWRPLAIALGATLGIAAGSALVDPFAWLSWFAMLARLDFPVIAGGLLLLPVDLWVRLPIAVALVTWGARTDRHWTVPVAMCLALPTIFVNSPTILVALLPLAAAGARTPAGRWLRSNVPVARGPAGPARQGGARRASMRWTTSSSSLEGPV